jgi:hypothetical protein
LHTYNETESIPSTDIPFLGEAEYRIECPALPGERGESVGEKKGRMENGEVSFTRNGVGIRPQVGAVKADKGVVLNY